MNIAVTPRIRSEAIRFADKMLANETLMEHIESNIAAIEEGKRSALTVLTDLEAIFTKDDFQVFPKVGSVAPKVITDTNTLYDWYTMPDGSDGRFYYDIVDRLRPDIVALKNAFQAFDKSKTDNKDELAKALPTKAMETFFRTFQHSTDEVTRQRRKYERRYSSARDMVLKAFHTHQIVERLNNLSLVSCRIEQDSEGGYDQSPAPVVFDNSPAHVADKAKTPFKRVLWSVGTLLLLERPERNEKGEPFENYTRLDNAIAQGGTYELILKCVEREVEGKNKSEAEQIRKLKADTPEAFLAVAQVLTTYGFEVTGLDWKIREKAETRLYTELKKPNKAEDRATVFKLFEMLDSLTTKLEAERIADVDKAAADAASKAA